MKRRTISRPSLWRIWLLLSILPAGAMVRGQVVNTITVNSLEDPVVDSDMDPGDSVVTLREAIFLSNTDGTPDKIVFDPALVGGIVWLHRPLPPLAEGLTEIDGDPVPDSTGPGPDFIRVILDSPDPLSGEPWTMILKITSGQNIIRSLVFGGRAKSGLYLYGPNVRENLVTACHFGYDPEDVVPAAQMTLTYGIYLGGGATLNVIGHLLDEGANVIANCTLAGVYLTDGATSRNRIIGNFIGSPRGDVAGNGNGVWLHSPSNQVGGELDSEGNVITANTLNGVLVEGSPAVFNTISHNEIYENGRLGIDLSVIGGTGDGPNLNPWSGNPDQPGPNNWLPAPVIRSYTHDSLPLGRHLFTLEGAVARPMTVEVYEADPDPSGYGEGRRFLGQADSDATGSFSVSLLLDPDTPVTLLGQDARGNTSEFSQTITLSTTPGASVIQMQTWQHILMLPRGFTRGVGLSTDQRSNTPLPVALSQVPAVIATVPAAVTIPTDSNHVVFPVTGQTPGSSILQMILPASTGGSSCNTGLFVDDAVPVTYDPVTERDDSLTGAIPARMYQVSGSAGDILNVYVNPAAGSAMDPVLYLFGRWPRNLSFKTNFRGPDCYLQFPLPEDGTYYIGVTDLYLRSGAAYSYHIRISRDPVNVQAGAPQFVERTALATSDRPNRLAFGDLNNDGWPDLVVGQPLAQKLQVRLKVPGRGTGFGPPVDLALGFVPGAVSIADLDRNGWQDILVARRDSGQITVLYNSGQFAKAGAGKSSAVTLSSRTFPAAGGGSQGATSDFNLDSYEDYALLDTTNKALYIFVNDQSGNLVQAQSLPAGTQPVAFGVGDFNGDQVPDIAVADGGQAQVYILKGQGTGQFALVNTLATVSQPADLKVTDLDNDGLGDLLVCGQNANILRTHKALQSFDFEDYQELATGQGPNSIAVADLNMDGYEDVSVANSGSGDIYIYMGLKLGLLQPVAQMSATGQIEELFWYSFGGGGSYFIVPPDQNFVRILEGTYRVLDFPDTEATESQSAAFAVANPADESALVYLSLYSENGDLIDDPDMENPVAVTISPHEQIAFFVTDAFGQGVSAYETWMRVASLNPEIQGFSLLVGGGSEPSLDGAVAQTEAAPRQILPTAGARADGADGTCFIVNPSAAATTVVVNCRGTAGQALTDPVQFSLTAGGQASFSFRDTFPQVGDPCYLDLQASQPVETFQFSGTSQALAATNGIPVRDDVEGASLSYVAHFAEGRLFRSFLEIFNAFPGEASVTVRAFTDDGSLLAQSASIDLPAGGMMEGELSELLGLDWQSADFITGYLGIESDQPMLYGTITFGDRQNGRFSSALMLQDTGASSLVFSHLAVGNVGGVDYFTGLTVLNIGGNEAHLTITVHDENGVQTGLGELVLPAGHKVSQMLPDFIPGFPSQVKGYIKITADEPDAAILAFELFGDTALDFLAAVPGQPTD